MPVVVPECPYVAKYVYIEKGSVIDFLVNENAASSFKKHQSRLRSASSAAGKSQIYASKMFMNVCSLRRAFTGVPRVQGTLADSIALA